MLEINRQIKKQTKFIDKQLRKLIKEKDYTPEKLREELNELVRRSYLAYDPVTGEYELQGKSMEIGLDMYAKMCKQYLRKK